jgi:DMSO/TMAO reductase YedYZ molybdopterin-dependent catalytic subunit
VAGGLGKVLSGVFRVSTNREDIVLPEPASAAQTLPDGIDPDVEGLTPFTTPADDFYRVDTALEIPRVDGNSWQLTVKGMVDNERTFTLADLLDRPLIERTITLVCVSNQVGGNLAGTARWLGVPLTELLDEAGVADGADQVLSRSVDNFTASTPLETIYDGRDAMVVVGMNGEPLPLERGFPARLLVPGLYGFVSGTKWLSELNVTTFEAEQAYWTKRGWAEDAPIKTFSRIDRPGGLGSSVDPGSVVVAGVAWDPHQGISKVELRVDDGEWAEATLAPVPSEDTWVQWTYDWAATSGSHNVSVRATNGAGETQPSERVDPIPDGATGWQQIVVNVT